jgi:hypothetical protein
MPVSLVHQIKLVSEWAPLLSFGQRWLAEVDPGRRIDIAGDCSEWLAAKTDTKFDDQIVSRLFAMLKTKEGEEFVRYLVTVGETVSAAAAAAEGVQS